MRTIAFGLSNTPFYVEKAYKLGLTGVTKLKAGAYHCRYGQGARYESLPNGQIVRKLSPCHADKVTAKFGPLKEKKKFEQLPTAEDLIISALHAADEPPPPRGYRLNKRKLRDRIGVYVDCMRRSRRWKIKQLYFFTVTFPEGTADDICYRLLNTWLTTLRTRQVLHSYLWVAERQQNGTVHFHMLVPHYLNVVMANRAMMVSICSMIRKKLLPWNLHQAKRYNGVDIAKDRKTKQVINFIEKKKQRTLAWYLTKYITKNETTSDRLCWNSSVDWSVPFKAVHLTRDELVKVVPTTGMILTDRLYETEYIQFWPWAAGPPLSMMKHLSFLNESLVADYFCQIGKGGILLN